MGASFSSEELAGAVGSGDHVLTSYAYATTNRDYFGVDATYSACVSSGITCTTAWGEVTPYLIPPDDVFTVTCEPLTIESPPTSQSLKCPTRGTSMEVGLYTVSFSAFTSTTSVDNNGITHYTRVDGPDTTLRALGGDITFSMVKPFTETSTTVTTTTTPTIPAVTTIKSGISELSPTSTVTKPTSTVTVTVYSTTVISTSTSQSTFKTGKVVTTTISCTPGKPIKCNANNCLRALKGRPSLASPFCSQYTTTTGIPTPSYLSVCDHRAASVSSAYTCFARSTAQGNKARAAIELPTYGPPDFAYSQYSFETTVTANPTTTITSSIASTTR
jgi:hypothetical protein